MNASEAQMDSRIDEMLYYVASTYDNRCLDTDLRSQVDSLNIDVSTWSNSTNSTGEPSLIENFNGSADSENPESPGERFDRWRRFFDNRPLMKCLDTDYDEYLDNVILNRLHDEIQRNAVDNQDSNHREQPNRAFWDDMRKKIDDENLESPNSESSRSGQRQDTEGGYGMRSRKDSTLSTSLRDPKVERQEKSAYLQAVRTLLMENMKQRTGRINNERSGRLASLETLTPEVGDTSAVPPPVHFEQSTHISATSSTTTWIPFLRKVSY